ncbi:MAG: hypothetical protein IPK68_10035 [Bdellovibrionales bacterium]|nr:hypothetical protein [Bdellovibrionales bacterium]
MFVEYKEVEGISVMQLVESFFKYRAEGACTGILDEHYPDKPFALVHIDLYWSLLFMMHALHEHGIYIERLLAQYLLNLDYAYGPAVMREYVLFRRANGIEMDIDLKFLKLMI